MRIIPMLFYLFKNTFLKDTISRNHKFASFMTHTQKKMSKRLHLRNQPHRHRSSHDWITEEWLNIRHKSSPPLASSSSVRSTGV